MIDEMRFYFAGMLNAIPLVVIFLELLVYVRPPLTYTKQDVSLGRVRGVLPVSRKIQIVLKSLKY